MTLFKNTHVSQPICSFKTHPVFDELENVYKKFPVGWGFPILHPNMTLFPDLAAPDNPTYWCGCIPLSLADPHKVLVTPTTMRWA